MIQNITLLITKLIKPRQKNGEIGVFKFAHGIVRANRIALVNHFIFRNGFHSYLEIGVRRKSDMYDKILTSRKVSVDPDPNAKAEFIMTSDEYFTAQDEKFDIIFIDGLHEGEQVKQDISNSLKVLNPGGVILLHDLNPPTAFHAREKYEVNGKFPAWNGTSWEGFAWHRKYSPELQMFVVDTDWGVGIIQKGKQINWEGDIKGYQVLKTHRHKLLNLISINEFLRRFN